MVQSGKFDIPGNLKLFSCIFLFHPLTIELYELGYRPQSWMTMKNNIFVIAMHQA